MLGAIVGAMSDQLQNRQAENYGRESAERQVQNQKRLNEDARQIAMQMWEDTNYSAQRDQLEKAGYNPNALFGGMGGGGTTASGSGGTASMATAPRTSAGTSAGIGNMAQMGMLESQKKLADAQTEATLAQANKTNIEASNIEEPIIANVGKTSAEKTAIELQNEKNKDTMAEQKETIASQSVQERNKAEVSTATLDAQKAQVNQDAINTALQAEAIKAGTNLDNEKTRAVAVELSQAWEELYQKARANDNQAGMVNIAGFKAKLDEILGKANLSLREKELMIRGAEAFMNALPKGRTTTTNTHESTPKGESYKSSQTTTKGY